MRRVICKDCHRVYDYDQDDFCPRCGSYNPPRDAGSTRLEQDLLSRFGDARANQSRAKSQQTARSAQNRAGAAPASRPVRSQGSAQWSPRPKPDQGHGGHTPAGGAVTCEERPAAPKWIVLIPVLVILAAFALFVAAPYFDGSGAPGGGTPVPAPKEYTEPWWEVGESFPLNDVTVSIEDVWWAETGGTLLEREGYALLLADVWIEGGGKRDADTPIATPYLRLEGGDVLFLEGSADLAKRVKNLNGAYVVDLRDYIWEDPLYGSFAFYVPEGTTRAVLCIEELRRGGEDLETVTLNQIELHPPIVD